MPEEIREILQTSKAEVIATKGAPVKTSYEQGFEVLWYGLKTPFRSTNYYFKDNVLVKVRVPITEQKTLSEFVDLYGQPESSLYLYNERSDTSDKVAHTWPEKGLTVYTSSEYNESKVIAQDIYKPTTAEAYLNNEGSYLSDKEVAQITEAPNQFNSSQTTQISNQSVLDSSTKNNLVEVFINMTPVHILIISSSLVGLIIVGLVFKYRKKD